MRSPGFTAEASLAGRRAPLHGRLGRRDHDRSLLSPQKRDCSDDGQLCYECDSSGCYCDWYFGDAYIVSTDYCSDKRIRR
jgi:hypothetical protein